MTEGNNQRLDPKRGSSRVPTLSLRAQRGNPVAVATAVRRRMFSLNEIATSLDELGMSGSSSQ